MSSVRPKRAALLQALNEEGRALSTATILFHQAIAARLGLAATDHKYLDILYRRGAMTAGQLASATGLTSGAITGLVDRLEEAGYVQRARDPGDRRRVVIEPVTNAARERRIGALFTSLNESMTSLGERYTDRELALVLDYLKQVAAVMAEETGKLRRRGKAHAARRRS